MTEIGVPEEQPEIEIIPAENPIPERTTPEPVEAPELVPA
jgi:hypothetical protein